MRAGVRQLGEETYVTLNLKCFKGLLRALDLSINSLDTGLDFLWFA